MLYFDDSGWTVDVDALAVGAAIKQADRSGLLCFCFGVSRNDLHRDLLVNGRSLELERITAATRAGRCRCELSNPSGKCCLGDLRAEIAHLRDGMPD